MPDDNEFARMNQLMNSDGFGGTKHVTGRSKDWTPGGTNDDVPDGCQVLHGFYALNGRQIASTIMVKSKLGFDGGDEVRLVQWFFEEGTLHQSTKVRGAPANFLGYIHDYGRNRIYAVTNIDEAARVVEIPKIGRVNDGWHVF